MKEREQMEPEGQRKEEEKTEQEKKDAMNKLSPEHLLKQITLEVEGK